MIENVEQLSSKKKKKTNLLYKKTYGRESLGNFAKIIQTQVN